MILGSQAECFLSALDPTAEEFCFRIFPDDRKRTSNVELPKNKDGEPTYKIDGSLDQVFDDLKRVNEAGYGVFVVINAGGHKNADINRIRAVYVDLDDSPVRPVAEYKPVPHLIIESSRKRWHAYWMVENLPVNQFEGVQRTLIKRFNGDPSVHNLSRVMRLPGFLHNKRKPFLVAISQNAVGVRRYGS